MPIDPPAHTPGPWEARPGTFHADGSSYFDLFGPDAYSLFAGCGDVILVNPANGPLLGAAPDLLAACEAVVAAASADMPGSLEMARGAVELARKAVAKAKGGNDTE